ncbi:hypothetical protein BaOVIS_022560 [Babesia ovis]|uniref:J domain-containing protein n=1 Tax=Babesia ovis TaxID=5869 RepID=A0A9W5WVZ9_BABOV|nr:hypothetical protein BaOVIS_022560 [Babesia ovis]
MQNNTTGSGSPVTSSTDGDTSMSTVGDVNPNNTQTSTGAVNNLHCETTSVHTPGLDVQPQHPRAERQLAGQVNGVHRHKYNSPSATRVSVEHHSSQSALNKRYNSRMQRRETDSAGSNPGSARSSGVSNDCSDRSGISHTNDIAPSDGSANAIEDCPSNADGESTLTWLGNGLVDMVVNNTSQIASMLQWGEAEAEYSLSQDVKEAKKLKDSMGQNSGRKDDKSSDSSADDDTAYTPSSSVADMTMYNRLGVECNASKSKIKQAYYKLALKYHPDKNPNDEEAKRKFQEIGEAYQILYDDTTRQQYDRQGANATFDLPMVDASLFFMLLFGSEALVDYIGTLKIANLVKYATSKSGRPKNMSGQIEMEQTYREVMLAVKLAERLDKEVCDGVVSEKLRTDLIDLCSGAFSDALVESIGWVYENCGDYYVAEATTFWGMGTTYANIMAAGRSLGNTWSMAKSVVNVALVVKDLKTDQDQSQMLSQLKDIVENVLSLVLYDVECTVRSAATKCCKDSDVSVEQRLARAHALISLGRCMQEIAQKYRSQHAEGPDVTKRLYDAYEKAAARKDGE